MPRSDSMGSSGGSITSEEGDAPAPATTSNAHRQSPSVTLAGTVRGTATEKFRQSVFKVMQMNKLSSGKFGGASRRPVGSEPGVDPRRATANAQYAHVHENCEIEIVDYSASSAEFNQYENKEFVNYMSKSKGARPSWAKVRWINIGGISWDVLSSLALAYDLHPLTLENVLHGRRTSRSKADYYQKWLFIHILCQSLSDSQTNASPLQQALASGGERTDSPLPIDMSAVVSPLAEKIPAVRHRHQAQHQAQLSDPEKGPRPKLQRENTSTRREARENRIRAADRANNVLRKTDTSVEVDVKNLFIYLGKDGTVISIHQADRGFGDPIYKRLRQREGLLRNTGDASLLLQALLDLVVDRAIDIVDRFHESILKIEREVLLNPKMRSVRDLHLLSGELTQRRRELDPVKTLIYGLRRYDADRAIAVVESATGTGSTSGAGGEGEKEKAGFLSHKSKVYLADVHEHAEFIMTSLEMFENITENLINYTFNVIAYETNEVMRRLTLATIIFLPLTLITGYFGMNFTRFDAIGIYSDAFVWYIGIPCVAVCCLLFLWQDLVKAIHYLKKTALVRRLDAIF